MIAHEKSVMRASYHTHGILLMTRPADGNTGGKGSEEGHGTLPLPLFSNLCLISILLRVVY